MPHHAKLLLNKVVEDGDTSVLLRHNINYDDMPTDTDRKVYRFITDYASDNGGTAPSYALVASSVEGYEYVPNVTDSYEYLTKQVKGFAAKQSFLRMFQSGDIERRLNEMDGNEFIEWQTEALGNIHERTAVKSSVGKDVKSGVNRFIEEYQRRKAGESFKIWKSKFSAVGEYISANVYTVFGESGRGKSVITIEDLVYMAQQGANVGLWSLEMGRYETMVRIYTALSGDLGVTKRLLDGVNMDAGFSASHIRNGSLSPQEEEAMFTFLRNINEVLPGNLYIRAKDDPDFTDRSVKGLERDIDEFDLDVIAVDPFYYLHYERNTSKTTGGDAAATSNKLVELSGQKDVVVIAITQADSTPTEENDEGVREVKVPERTQVKKTAALLEDAAILIGVDSDYQQGIAVVGNLKGRNGGEGDISNVVYIPQYGVVKEIEVGEDEASKFNF